MGVQSKLRSSDSKQKITMSKWLCFFSLENWASHICDWGGHTLDDQSRTLLWWPGLLWWPLHSVVRIFNSTHWWYLSLSDTRARNADHVWSGATPWPTDVGSFSGGPARPVARGAGTSAPTCTVNQSFINHPHTHATLQLKPKITFEEFVSKITKLLIRTVQFRRCTLHCIDCTAEKALKL